MTENKQTEPTARQELRAKLERGDYNALAEATGMSRETVKKTLAGERHNEAVIQAAEMLIKSREIVKQQFQMTFQGS